MTDQPRQIDRGLLTIRTAARHVYLIALDGEMDGANARDLELELMRIEATGAARIVLDLSRLEFVESTGLAVIVRAHERAKQDGHSLVFMRPEGDVVRTFEVTGLDQELSFVN
jgi:anti-sigma B factor antagonist